MEPQSSASKSVRFSTFDLDLQSGELHKSGRKIRLPHQSFRILVRLLERPGEVVSRDDLHKILWPDGTYVDFEVGLSSAVKRLRDALGDSAENPRFVETVPRFGYRFIAPVNGAGESARLRAPVPVAPGDTAASTEPLSKAVHVDPLRSFRAGAAVTGLALIAGLGLLNYHSSDRLFGSTAARMRSIAVLPLENLTGDPAQDYFVDGLTDAFTTTLAETSGLRVTPRSSTAVYKANKKPLHLIGPELNVEFIVEGAVVRSGNHARVSVHLIDTRDERQLWAQNFDKEVDDIVSLQEDVADTIAQTTVGTLTGRQPARKVSAAAEDLFFRAVSAAGRDNYQGFVEAIKYADAATDKQPDFARAWARKAGWLVQFSFNSGMAPSEYMLKAEAAAQKALDLDPTIPEAHAALGIVLYRYHWNWSKGEQALRRSLELNASSAEGHRRLAGFLSTSGRADEAVKEASLAKSLDPLSAQALMNLGLALRDAGKLDEAITYFQQVVDMRRDLARAHFQLGISYVTKGSLDRGIQELEQAVSIRPATSYRSHLACAYALNRETDKARKILGDVTSITGEFVPPVDVAGMQSCLGQREEALASLEKACEVRDPALMTLPNDNRLLPLRSEARFQAVLRRVGLIH